MDLFQGWFKDGTQGTRDYRSLSVLYMLTGVGFVFMVLALHITDIKTDAQNYYYKIIYIFIDVTHFTITPVVLVQVFKHMENETSNE